MKTDVLEAPFTPLIVSQETHSITSQMEGARRVLPALQAVADAWTVLDQPFDFTLLDRFRRGVITPERYLKEKAIEGRPLEVNGLPVDKEAFLSWLKVKNTSALSSAIEGLNIALRTYGKIRLEYFTVSGGVATLAEDAEQIITRQYTTYTKSERENAAIEKFQAAYQLIRELEAEDFDPLGAMGFQSRWTNAPQANLYRLLHGQKMY